MNNLDAQVWYQSAVMRGAVVSIVSQLVAILGLHVTSDELANDVGAVFQVIAICAALYSAYKRKSSTIQPLTLTQTGADLHPNTLANAQAPLPVTQPSKVGP
jgi:hypothetical protein